MGGDPAYLELLDSNHDLRIKLLQEETKNIAKDKEITILNGKIRKLISEVQDCER
jgi:hypothetical protein